MNFTADKPKARAEMRKKSMEDLRGDLSKFKHELMSMRISQATSSSTGSKNLSKIKILRKKIARVLTVQNEKNLTEVKKMYKQQKGKKRLPKDLRPKKTRAIRRELTKGQKRKLTIKQRKKKQNLSMRNYALLA
eukprot:GHVU01003664.1.p1 GENE.GHVU01003664.1~~GHVU01003664.1.p1  ORF type:complete len:134 (-),score=39.99 GHVU01003664.1:214-615(-)